MTPSLSAHRGGSPVGFVDRMIRRGSRGIQNIVGMAPKHDEDVKGKSKVVIIGGGFAGRRCQSLLSSGFDVTLIDAKGYWEYTPAALRNIVEPLHARTCVLPQPQGTVVGKVVGIEVAASGGGGDGNLVKVSDGSVHPFDYCIISCGSSYTAPVRGDMEAPSTPEGRMKEFERAFKELEAAKSVVVVGGGTSGVEMAAEVAGKFGKSKDVTLVAGQHTLLDRMHPACGQYAQRWLESRGVKVLLGHRIMDWGEGGGGGGGGRSLLRTSRGVELQADKVYKCVGFSPLAGAVRQGSLSGSEHPRGGVSVNGNLQVVGSKHVFAVGDCATSPAGEEKTAFSADLGARLVAKNIRRMEGGHPVLPFPEGATFGAPRCPDIANVSLYKWHAVMEFNGLVIKGALAALAKALIEFLQVQTAKGNPVLTAAWDVMEHCAVYVAKWLYVGRRREGQPPSDLANLSAA